MLPDLRETMLKKEELTFRVPRFVKMATWKGVTGFFAGGFFNIIHPFSGAIFASTQSVMQQLLAPGVTELLTEGGNLPSRVYIFVITFLFSAVVAISTTISMGFDMSFPAAVWLSIFMIPTGLLIDYLFKSIITPKKPPEPTATAVDETPQTPLSDVHG